MSGAIVHGLAVYTERDILSRSVTVFTAPFPRVSHVPRVRMSFSIDDCGAVVDRCYIELLSEPARGDFIDDVLIGHGKRGSLEVIERRHTLREGITYEPTAVVRRVP